jgi:hypothetical protein
MITNNSLSREHIKYVLGIDVSLNESIALHPSTYKLILEEQLIYESFLKDLIASIEPQLLNLKDKSKEQLKKFTLDNIKNTAVNVIDDIKDLKIIFAKALSNSVVLNKSIKWINDAINNKLDNIVNTVSKYIPEANEYIKNVIEKIKTKYNSIKPWGKFLLGVAAIAAVNYITKYIKTFTFDQLKKFLSGTALGNVIDFVSSTMKSVQEFFGIFGVAAGYAKSAYELLQPFIEFWREEFKLTSLTKIGLMLSKSAIPSIQEIRKLQRRAGIYL